jgi:hypothetical protein
MILPYVYKLTNTITGEFYFGYRSKNVGLKLKAEEDIGQKYFTSSKYIKNEFQNFFIEILAEFFSSDDAYDFEQELIAQYFNHPKCLNRHYQRKGEKGRFKHSSPHLKNSKEKMKGKRGKINRIKPGHPAWNKGLTKEVDIRIATMAMNRHLARNDHQIGLKHSKDRLDKVKQKLTGRKMLDSQIQKMSQAKKNKTWEEIYGFEGAAQRRKGCAERSGSNHANSKKIYTPHGIFNSITESAEHFSLSDYTIRKRCLSKKEKWKEWYYV